MRVGMIAGHGLAMMVARAMLHDPRVEAEVRNHYADAEPPRPMTLKQLRVQKAKSKRRFTHTTQQPGEPAKPIPLRYLHASAKRRAIAAGQKE